MCKMGVTGLHDSYLMFLMPFAPSICFERGILHFLSVVVSHGVLVIGSVTAVILASIRCALELRRAHCLY